MESECVYQCKTTGRIIANSIGQGLGAQLAPIQVVDAIKIMQPVQGVVDVTKPIIGLVAS